MMRISWVEALAISCGGIPVSAENVKSLQEQGIGAIVTLTEHPLTSQKELTAELFAEAGIEVLHVPVVDQQPPTKDQAHQVLEFVTAMKNRQKPVYIHCHAGIGRTGTMLHAVYLLSGMKLEDAKQKIKATRPTSQFFMLSDSQKEFLENLATELGM
jgi:atypical dual specificity phosphatase